jgi:hypothetical protein
MIVPYALVILFNTEVGPIYLVEAGVMALSQVLTRGAFAATGQVA